MIELPDFIKDAMAEISEESSDFMKVEIMKIGGVKYLKELGQAKSTIDKVIAIIEGLPGVSKNIDISNMKDSSRFLDAVVQKFMDSVIWNSEG